MAALSGHHIWEEAHTQSPPLLADRGIFVTQTWRLPSYPERSHWFSPTLSRNPSSQLALRWRTDCLGVCGDKADIHLIVSCLTCPLEAVGYFFLLLIQQLLLQTPTLGGRGLKGGDRHPHLWVCVILLSARRPVTGTDLGKEPMKSYGKNNSWKNIVSGSFALMTWRSFSPSATSVASPQLVQNTWLHSTCDP